MMSLDDFLFDKRTVQRNIEAGKLDVVRYQQMLDALPDLSGSLWRRPEISGHEVVTAPQSPAQRPDAARPEPSAPAQLQPAPAV